jgi:hypothetical protein
MKRALTISSMVLAAALLGAAPARATNYGFQIKISPMPGADKQFVCEATLTDLATNQVVFAPRLQVLAGKSNVASSGGEKGGRDYLLSVSIEGEAKEARYTLEVHDGETLIDSEKASVKLR